MIIVTGTKRSGTSMWMQLLKAAGFPPIGQAFPRNWETTLKDANPAGFWESELRRGIYYETNPDPKTGAYLFPEQTERYAVKVFIPGLIKTDRAFIGKVIATLRPWRQYVHSVNRLYSIERKAKEAARAQTGEEPLPQVFMPPAIEWWVENFSLISDIVTRRYPCYIVAYDSVVGSPEDTLSDVFGWLGDGNVEAAIRGVDPALRTHEDLYDDQTAMDELGIESEVVEVFDALYDVVLRQRCLEQSFIDRLNDVNEKLSEQISEAMKSVNDAQRQRKRLLQQRRREAGERPNGEDRS
jgi:hypothetical protein